MYRYGYTIQAPTTLRKYDLATGTSTVHDFGAGRVPGWFVSFAYDVASDRNDFVVLDASDAAAKAVAVVPLPVRVPHVFTEYGSPNKLALGKKAAVAFGE